MPAPSRSALAILAAVTLVCAPPADPDPGLTDAERAAIEDQLRQMEYDWVGAYESGDFAALDRIFAEDFIYTIPDGTVHDKTSFIALAEQDPIDYDSVRIESLELRWYGSTPVITGIASSFWTVDGAVQQDRGQFTNVFVERDGRWQVVVGHSSDLPPR